MRLVFLTVLGAFLAASHARADLPGDTVEDPLPVLTIPFVASGSTCPYENDYDEFCPIDGQMSPDVVYAYAPAMDIVVNLSLCESGYDTKILVYENDPFQLYACNDDWCSGPDYDDPYLAYLRELPLSAGNVYYFVVDGYGSSCGPYVLRITQSVGCNLVCPAGADEESEIKCPNGSNESSNGGCSSDPPLFQTLAPSPDPIAICGFTNSEAGLPGRDQDWYEIVPLAPDTITVQCEADFAVFLSVLDGAAGCDPPLPIAHCLTEPCEIASFPVAVPGGPVWILMQPLLAWSVSCPAEYVLTLEGYEGEVTAIPPPDAVAPSAAFPELAASPNPFVRDVSIRGSESLSGAITLRVHNVAGQIIRTLHAGPLPSGPWEFAWDGRDHTGRDVPAGVYFCRYSAAGTARTAKIVRAGR